LQSELAALHSGLFNATHVPLILDMYEHHTSPATGMAVQVDPMKPTLKAPASKRLKQSMTFRNKPTLKNVICGHFNPRRLGLTYLGLSLDVI
jgi:hypothetical protein